ncbi:2-oxo-4-hydroxy-4-carboxy-5-ureidoimidazoline decarboxylase [Caulobacter sp. KR2-114]|uniref:2-oxo-4-hydroxy-4-carboxy-5-ureidoimidazoline decarboxylase n=1 Tax=Caulobacter sp. KR2-114 TaxID=3400912 RepID=UPI003BFCA438
MTPDRATFLARYGGVYEASPWVAEAVWSRVADGTIADLQALKSAMADVVDGASHEARMALVRAHPELASRARMADASVREQSGAGLDQCSAEEFAAFQRLNAGYNARFGFPFIVAVKGLTRGDILEQFKLRLNNDAEVEFRTAMAQIHRIAGFRLDDLGFGA